MIADIQIATDKRAPERVRIQKSEISTDSAVVGKARYALCWIVRRRRLCQLHKQEKSRNRAPPVRVATPHPHERSTAPRPSRISSRVRFHARSGPACPPPTQRRCDRAGAPRADGFLSDTGRKRASRGAQVRFLPSAISSSCWRTIGLSIDESWCGFCAETWGELPGRVRTLLAFPIDRKCVATRFAAQRSRLRKSIPAA